MKSENKIHFIISELSKYTNKNTMRIHRHTQAREFMRKKSEKKRCALYMHAILYLKKKMAFFVIKKRNFTVGK